MYRAPWQTSQGHVDVGQEVHLDLERAVSLAGLAAPALDVEGEAPRPVSADLRLGHGCEDLADVVPYPGVGGGIGPGGAPDRRLVDVDDLVEVVDSSDRLMPSGHAARTIELVGEHLVEDGVDQGGLARAGYSCDSGQYAEREGDGDVLEVVFAGADDGDLTVLIALAPLGRDLDPTPPGQVVAGDRALGSGQALDVTGVDDLTAQFSGSGTDVNDPVGRADGVRRRARRR